MSKHANQLTFSQLYLHLTAKFLSRTATHCNAQQRTATHCNTLQHTATHCNTLQHTATHCNTCLTVELERPFSHLDLHLTAKPLSHYAIKHLFTTRHEYQFFPRAFGNGEFAHCFCVSRCVEVCCSESQCVAVCCSVLQSVAVYIYCSVLHF